MLRCIWCLDRVGELCRIGFVLPCASKSFELAAWSTRPLDLQYKVKSKYVETSKLQNLAIESNVGSRNGGEVAKHPTEPVNQNVTLAKRHRIKSNGDARDTVDFGADHPVRRLFLDQKTQ